MTAAADGVYIAIDTNGLPNKDPGWSPVVIAVGLARIVNGQLTDNTGGLVNQPSVLLRHRYATGAWRANGMTPEEVEAATIRPWELAPRIRQALGGLHPRGFNVEFLHAMLKGTPWRLTTWGLCVMVEASAAVLETPMPNAGLVAGDTKAGHLSDRKGNLRGGKQKRPRYTSLNNALSWATERGHDVMAPIASECRAHANAVRVAKLAVAVKREQGS